ncbi:MAG: patatin-like phospholipase family protein [Kiritimatiellia bacterium]
MTHTQMSHPGTCPRIGLALGSGGARGWAHVGVLRHLQELNVPIYCVAGTSIGSIMGAVFAARRLDVIEDLSRQIDWRRVARMFVEVGFPRAGLVTGHRIQQLIQEVVGVNRIEDLQIPFAAVAANLKTGEQVVLSRGSVVDAIRASIAIPGIFVPAQHDGHHLVDGGTINPLPIDVAESMGADVVIAVDVNLLPGRGIDPSRAIPPERHGMDRDVAAILAHTREALPRVQSAFADAMERWFRRETTGLTIFDVLTRSVRIAENQITHGRLKLYPPALLIQPAVGSIETLEFHRASQAIEAGRAAAIACESQILALLGTCRN